MTSELRRSTRRSTRRKVPAQLPRGLLHRPASARTETGNATVNVLYVAGLVGLVALGNHGTQFDVRQTRYASREDCLQDWGDEDSCRAAGQGSGVYFGPRYYWDPDRNRPVIVDSNGSEHVATTARIGSSDSPSGRTAVVGSFARGGFGGIGRGFSSGRGG